MKKKRIVVVCPGRGTYTKETLGYLKQFEQDLDFQKFIKTIDALRIKNKETSISEIDNAEKFSPNLHSRGEHASSLIYACSYGDFLSLDLDRYEIVAITGNSMGWYIALGLAGVLNTENSFQVINTMGSMMKEEIIGGQIIYSLVNDDWTISQEKINICQEIVGRLNSKTGIEIYPSIHLGGYLVLGANKEGCRELLKELPKQDPYPFQLLNHAAFHTPLLKDTSNKAFEVLSEKLFQKPKFPLIDGRGKIWSPFTTDVTEIYEYTLGHQVYEVYDFTTAIIKSLKEFHPDHLVLLGPGSNLGGAIGQAMIKANWYDLKSKDDFSRRQKENPILLSMGIEGQREMLSKF